METLSIRRAALADIDALVTLLDEYRHFYGQESDTRGTRRFLLDRFEQNESTVFLAFLYGRPVGFVQIYPSFSTVSLARTCILNDLYVSVDARRKGVGKKLLEAAASYCRQHGSIRLTLSTGVDNAAAQALYLEAGWRRDEQFFVYNLPL